MQVGVDVESSRWGVRLAEEHPGVLATVAIHPNDAPRVADLDEALREIEALAAHPRVRAIGETGLDHFRTAEDGRAVQERSFREHIAIAKRYDRTLMIHDRDAHADVLRVLDEEGAPDRVVMHCFSGDAEFAVECLKRGFLLSFAGTVTFANARDLREAAALTPPDCHPGGDRCPVPDPDALPGPPQRLVPDPADRTGIGRAHWHRPGLDVRRDLGQWGAGVRTMAIASSVRPPLPPGPRGHWLLGSLPEIQRDMPQTLLDVTREFGGVTRLRVGPASMYLVADGDLIVELIAKRAGELRKSNRTRQSLGGHLGRGLVTLEGAEHRRHRRLVQPVMHTRSIAAQAQAMVDLPRARVESWPDGSTVDVLREMQDLTLRIVCSALFHLDEDRDAERLVSAVHAFAASLNVVLRRAFPVPAWIPTRGNRLRRRTVREVDALAYDLIRRRRREPGDDLLSMLVLATDADGGPALSDVEVRDELMTMFFAGHETSAAALTWALYLLASHPEVADSVRAEIAAAVGDRAIEMTDLPKLPLLGQVVAETLRLYPPAWVFDRSPLHNLVIGGYAIPAGANVLLSPWVAHRDPRHWEAPDEFRPQRFAGGFTPPRGAYLPFGDGPRMCVGNRFAEVEIQLVLAALLARVDLSIVDTRNRYGLKAMPRSGPRAASR